MFFSLSFSAAAAWNVCKAMDSAAAPSLPLHTECIVFSYSRASLYILQLFAVLDVTPL